jgi:hypothetical protein
MSPEEIKAQVEKALAEFKPKLQPGARSSEFLLIVGLGLASLLNPLLKKFLGVEVPADQFVYLASLAGGFLASRTGLKAFLK